MNPYDIRNNVTADQIINMTDLDADLIELNFFEEIERFAR